jgi:glyoxylase I family protein
MKVCEKTAVKRTPGPLDMSDFIPEMKVCWFKDHGGNIIEINQGYIDEKSTPSVP